MIDPNKHETLLILQKQELERRLHQIETFCDSQPARMRKNWHRNPLTAKYSKV